MGYTGDSVIYTIDNTTNLDGTVVLSNPQTSTCKDAVLQVCVPFATITVFIAGEQTAPSCDYVAAPSDTSSPNLIHFGKQYFRAGGQFSTGTYEAGSEVTLTENLADGSQYSWGWSTGSGCVDINGTPLTPARLTTLTTRAVSANGNCGTLDGNISAGGDLLLGAPSGLVTSGGKGLNRWKATSIRMNKRLRSGWSTFYTAFLTKASTFKWVPNSGTARLLILLVMGATCLAGKAQTREWIWVGGSSTIGNGGGQTGVYGTLGTPAPGNLSGGRYAATTWADNAGNFWLFGGGGIDANGTLGNLNDLWEFSSSSNEWAWMAGSSTVGKPYGQPGVYGALGVPAAGNIPGFHQWAGSWTDSSGNFWLFGGQGVDASGNGGYLNDLWSFSPSTNLWTWMDGSNTLGSSGVGQPGVYGTLGTPNTANIPGGRYGAVSWTDDSGNFWLFGGFGSDASGVESDLNDLWEFNPSTKQWTWMAGSSTVGNSGGQPGVYGTLRTPTPGNIPGGRYGATSWIDSSGNFWLFGGVGLDAIGNNGYLNDLWEFNPSTNQWAWVGGSSTVVCTPSGCGQPGLYGTLGSPASGNIPGARSSGANWIDGDGNLWLFGGYGFDAIGNNGYLNDLWEFNPSANQWAWVGGTSTVVCATSGCGQPGLYGTLGSPASGNIPGARSSGATWIDSHGNLWLFGGYGFDGGGSFGFLNDLWEYPLSPNGHPTGVPIFSLAPGTYTSTQTVTITDATPGAMIYFTTNGSTPTTSSTPYSGPITVSSTETIQAIATANGYSNSAVATAAYTINNLPPAATPTFSVAPGAYTTAQSVGISDSTSGEIIYYTTNGTTPTPSSTPYSGPITVSSSETLRAIATATGYSTSAVASAAYTINLPLAATPTFSVAPGTYTSAQTVAILDSAPSATIYYTINGTTPTTSSSVYSGAITVSATETIQAIATASGHSKSAVATAAYSINLPPPAPTPTFSVAPGTYTSAQSVAILDSAPSAIIYYTTNGTTPTTSSSVDSGAITVSSTETLQAIATATGYSTSAVASAAYTINPPPAAKPTFSVAPGTYTSAQMVTILDSTPSAAIYYTTNGTNPTTSSSVYRGAITVSSTETIQAIATASGYSTSAAATAAYTINPPPAATPTFSVAPGTYTSAQTVAIVDSTPSAAIYYTTNGTTPTTSSSVYSGAITVSSTETIQAIATASGYSTSTVATGAYTINLPPAATPTFSVAPGAYTAAQSVAILDSTPGAAIYYTTNGTTPTTSSSVYSGAITVSSAETLQAVAAAAGYSTSAVASAAYTINLPQAATPTFSVAPGAYTAAQSVAILDSMPSVAIYYTTNGTTPTTSSSVYGGAITVSSTETIQAIAAASGYSTSAVATAAYAINLPPPAATPTFSVAAGAYTAAQSVAILDSMPSVAIYYTTNGTTPTTSSTPYSGPITVPSSETLQAIATATGYSTSAAASATYTITAPSQATPVMTVTPWPSSVTTAQALSVTVTVNGGNGSPAPTGTVTLTSGSYTSAVTTLSGGGTTINIPAGSLATGSDTLTVIYSGDGNYIAATGVGSVSVTTAVNSSFTVSGTAVSVTPGGTTANTSIITVTSAGGFTGSVALTASITASPAGAQHLPALSFGTTSPVIVTNSKAGTGTLTISTTAATSAGLVHPRRPGTPWYAAGGATLACILLFGIPGRRPRWQAMLGMLTLLVALSGGLFACGGSGSGNEGGGGGTSSPGTTAGTYTITVTGTSDTTTATGTETLTVQ
jgi:N-acetylneuraminic acid mutarotase